MTYNAKLTDSIQTKTILFAMKRIQTTYTNTHTHTLRGREREEMGRDGEKTVEIREKEKC